MLIGLDQLEGVVGRDQEVRRRQGRRIHRRRRRGRKLGVDMSGGTYGLPREFGRMMTWKKRIFGR